MFVVIIQRVYRYRVWLALVQHQYAARITLCNSTLRFDSVVLAKGTFRLFVFDIDLNWFTTGERKLDGSGPNIDPCSSLFYLRM